MDNLITANKSKYQGTNTTVCTVHIIVQRKPKIFFKTIDLHLKMESSMEHF